MCSTYQGSVNGETDDGEKGNTCSSTYFGSSTSSLPYPSASPDLYRNFRSKRNIIFTLSTLSQEVDQLSTRDHVRTFQKYVTSATTRYNSIRVRIRLVLPVLAPASSGFVGETAFCSDAVKCKGYCIHSVQ